MLRIQIGNNEVLPEEVFSKMKERFEADKQMGILPMLAVVTDPKEGEATKFASVVDIGRDEHGNVFADLGIDICFNLENDTARIVYLLLKEEEGPKQELENRLFPEGK